MVKMLLKGFKLPALDNTLAMDESAPKELFGNNFDICIEQGLNTNVRRRQGMLVFQL
jgi:hypothetical protein